MTHENVQNSYLHPYIFTTIQTSVAVFLLQCGGVIAMRRYGSQTLKQGLGFLQKNLADPWSGSN